MGSSSHGGKRKGQLGPSVIVPMSGTHLKRDEGWRPHTIDLYCMRSVDLCCMRSVTPQTRGSVDYPSTRRIQVDVGLPDATSENRAESPLYGELYPNETPA